MKKSPSPHAPKDRRKKAAAKQRDEKKLKKQERFWIAREEDYVF